MAPAPNLDSDLRERICADTLAFARAVGYVCAGTVEFLLDERAQPVFVQCNPRIQLEHNVTEEIADVHLVASQLRISSGETLADLGLSQESLRVRGRGDAMPHHHRGPDQRVPSRRWPHQRLLVPGRRECPPGRRSLGGEAIGVKTQCPLPQDCSVIA